MVADEARQSAADLVLAGWNDCRVRNRQAERPAKQRSDREPVGEPADERGLGERAHALDVSVRGEEPRRGDIHGAHGRQQRGGESARAAQAACKPGVRCRRCRLPASSSKYAGNLFLNRRGGPIRVGRVANRPADDDVVCAGAKRDRRSNDALLIAARAVGRAECPASRSAAAAPSAARSGAASSPEAMTPSQPAAAACRARCSTNSSMLSGRPSRRDRAAQRSSAR